MTKGLALDKEASGALHLARLARIHTCIRLTLTLPIVSCSSAHCAGVSEACRQQQQQGSTP